MHVDFGLDTGKGLYCIAFILSDDNFTPCCFSNYFSVILGLHNESIYEVWEITHNIFRIYLFCFLTILNNLVGSYDCCLWCVAGSC